jgi:hypothetical protein
MKAEKRHELEKNELADWLGEHIEAAKPYAPTIGIVLVGGVCVLLLAIYLLSSGGAASARAWSMYFTAVNERDPEVPLEQFAKDMPNSPASLWALQAVGDINLTQGAQQLFSDREAAKKSLEKAEMALKKVDAETTDRVLKTRAQLSLGKLYESLCKPDEAKKYYEQIVAAEKDSAIGKLAERAVKRLSDPREVAMLAWFAEQKPRRPSPGLGTGGLPGFPNDLPERPDLSLPGLGSGATDAGPDSGVGTGLNVQGLNLEGLGTGNTAQPTLEFPKPAETKPGESKPAEGDKSTEPGASGEPTAPAEKPADGTPPAVPEKPAEPLKPE